MPHRKIHLRFGFALALVVVVAGSVPLAFIPQWRPAALLARHWQRQLAELPDDQLDTQLRRIAQLDRPGLEVLAAAMGHSREAVSAAARRVTWETVEQWKMMASGVSAEKCSALAREMARQMDVFDDSSRRLAGDVAYDLMALFPTDDSAQRMQFVGSCERILGYSRTIDKSRGRRFLLVDAESESNVQRRSHRLKFSERHTLRSASGMDPRQVNVLPGGAIPVEVAEIPLPTSLAQGRETDREARLSETIDDPPRRIEPERKARSIVQFSEPKRFNPPLTRRIPFKKPPGGTTLGIAPAQRPLSWEVPLNSSKGAEPVWEFMNDRQVIDILRDGTAQIVSAAEAELKRRGFTVRERQLAKRLTDPDPVIREGLLEIVSTGHFNHRNWLAWLAADEDPSIRSAAIAIMATTGDPHLKRRLHRMQLDEENPEVARQIGEILARQR